MTWVTLRDVVYKKNTSIVIDKMVYNLLADRGEGYPYDYDVSCVQHFSTHTVWRYHQGRLLPYDERGRIVKVKPTGERRFTNIKGVRSIEIPVRAKYTWLWKVYGTWDGEFKC